MVKRHTLLAHHSFPDLPAEVVSAQDYDALAARLAEAEEANRVCNKHHWEMVDRLAEAERLLARISKVPTSPMLAPIQHAAMKWITDSAEPRETAQ